MNEAQEAIFKDLCSIWILGRHNDDNFRNDCERLIKAGTIVVDIGEAVAALEASPELCETMGRLLGMCPRPVIPDHSAKACVESDNCGCGADSHSSAGSARDRAENYRRALIEVEREMSYGSHPEKIKQIVKDALDTDGMRAVPQQVEVPDIEVIARIIDPDSMAKYEKDFAVARQPTISQITVFPKVKEARAKAQAIITTLSRRGGA